MHARECIRHQKQIKSNTNRHMEMHKQAFHQPGKTSRKEKGKGRSKSYMHVPIKYACKGFYKGEYENANTSTTSTTIVKQLEQ